MSDEGHKYTQYGFDGSYWEKKERKTVYLLDPDMIHHEPDTEVTWVGENGITWVFVDEEGA